MTETAYACLERDFARIAVLEDAAGILGWDARTAMPLGAAEGRAEQLAALRGLVHEALTAEPLADRLDEAEAQRGALEPWQAANLREMRRTRLHAAAVPRDLVVARARATSRAEIVWREARRTSDFPLLRPHLEDVVGLQRAIGQAKGAALGIPAYDALLDQYDPGLRQSRVDALFGPLRRLLPDLIGQVREHQARSAPPRPIAGDFPVAAQRALAETVMRAAGFDFARGRLDVSLHPFCGGATGDVRITTRYDGTDFTRALMGVLHETGHALYEQGRPAAWQRQPVGRARGMTLHESQSLLIEMQACRSREFLGFLAPLIGHHFGREDPAWSSENLYRLYTRVAPGLIRVDADEVTYPAHILLRYDLERAMIAGDLAVADLPGAFAAGMKDLLGLTVGDDADGCLQDIHWPSGGWGYFPTYTLGAVTAAQLFAAACEAEAEIRPGLARGDFAPLVGWLRTHIHAVGSSRETDEIVAAATGKPTDLDAFLAHLRRRYLGEGERP
ncbi:carboxypeptidase M32 [Methylobacterium oryzisoli]|uniref:carboxypeptidase M32 n=1 Tax=Methylobacterium oryzisoli TaxID=3385502 RepID=UPI003892C130